MRQFPSSKAHPELDALLLATKGKRMTKKEISAQKKSWVIGEMLLSNPDMSREEALRIYAEIEE